MTKRTVSYRLSMSAANGGPDLTSSAIGGIGRSLCNRPSSGSRWSRGDFFFRLLSPREPSGSIIGIFSPCVKPASPLRSPKPLFARRSLTAQPRPSTRSTALTDALCSPGSRRAVRLSHRGRPSPRPSGPRKLAEPAAKPPAVSRLAGMDGDADGPGPDITATQKMISAMSGSLLTSLLVTPLDVVRVRLQSQKTPTAAVHLPKLPPATNTFSAGRSTELGVTACCREVFFAGNHPEICLVTPRLAEAHHLPVPSEPAPECAVQEVRRRTYSSTLDGLRKIARNEGLSTLWRGLSPTLVMTIPANIIYFTGYDWLRYSAASPFEGLSPNHAPLISGSIARVLAATAVGPIELVRTRMQAASSTSTTNHLLETFRGIRDMVAIHGYTSLWRGLTLTLWRDVPFSGLYWWGYETIRAKLTDLRDRQSERGRTRLSNSRRRQEARRRSQSRENHTETFMDSFAAGALSGTFASIITTPFDVGKTRTQVYRDVPKAPKAGGSGAVPAPEERNIVRLLWHIFKTEGVRGLWRGWIPRTLKVAPACAIMISSYEVGKRAFRGVNQRARPHEERAV